MFRFYKMFTWGNDTYLRSEFVNQTLLTYVIRRINCIYLNFVQLNTNVFPTGKNSFGIHKWYFTVLASKWSNCSRTNFHIAGFRPSQLYFLYDRPKLWRFATKKGNEKVSTANVWDKRHYYQVFIQFSSTVHYQVSVLRTCSLVNFQQLIPYRLLFLFDKVLRLGQ